MEFLKQWGLEIISSLFLFFSGMGTLLWMKAIKDVDNVKKELTQAKLELEIKAADLKLKQLNFESEMKTLMNSMNKEILQMSHQMDINKEKDRSYQEVIQITLKAIKDDLDHIKAINEKWQKDAENFYYMNPDIKKPDVKF